jgi:hypothetical protein
MITTTMTPTMIATMVLHATMQIRKGSPKQQQMQEQNLKRSGSSKKDPKHPHKSKKKSRTTHATASCVFCVVGPLNQLGSISWLGFCELHSLNAKPSFHCDKKVAQPCSVCGHPSGPPYT